MVRKGRRKATQPLDSVTDQFGWQVLLNSHIAALEVKNFALATIGQRAKYIPWFALWCIERGATKSGDVTKALVERYQRYLYNHRDTKGKPMSFPSQHKHLSHLKSFFSWLAKHNHVLFNPASELELPNLGN